MPSSRPAAARTSSSEIMAASLSGSGAEAPWNELSEIERHDAVVLECGAEPVDGVAHVLTRDAIELLDQAVGGIVEDVVVALHLGRVIGLDVAVLAVGAAKRELPAQLFDFVPVGGVHSIAAAPGAQLDLADVQLGA